MRSNRRTFLKWSGAAAGAGLAGIAWWASTSQRRTARWLRRLAQDARRTVEPATVRPDPFKFSEREITICWLGHASVLINFYGLTILTDPALVSRVGISLGVGIAGPKRYVAPALTAEELPRIDVLLISHAHMDHLDLPTLRRLQEPEMTVSAKLTSDLLASAGRRRIRELGWGDRTRVETAKGSLEIEAFEVKHWGQRWPGELERGYNGYVLRREGKALIFGGDTALCDHFRGLRSRGPFEAAIMPIGAYRPWIRNHCTPEEALQMANEAGAPYILPVHHKTFILSDEPLGEPIQRLTVALEREPQRLGLSRPGESFICPA